MNILHYSLGFPPYRSGGLTKFCMDLMYQQLRDGHRVSLLWPGSMELINRSTRIKKRMPVNGIGSYEILNPLPVPYDEGIEALEAFMKAGNPAIYRRFLKDLKPDVVHIHTLMGLHAEFLYAVREEKIRLVFSAHDFFPICPKVTLFRNGAICADAENCSACAQCNQTALSLGRICFLQSGIYRSVKDTPLVKMYRKRHRDGFLNETARGGEIPDLKDAEEYRTLRHFYGEMLQQMDRIHFNSSVTQKVYHAFFTISEECLVPITHKDVADKRRRKSFSSECLRIRYLGPQGTGKGFLILKDALDHMWQERINFCLDVHFTPNEIPPYLRCHDRYTYEELEEIFAETDVLVCPSLWYETFGYTVIEALSFGVPVVISGTVGAKDIVAEGAGIVIEDIDSRKLQAALSGLTAEKLSDMNLRIMESQPIQSIVSMSRELEEKLYSC